MLEAMAAVRLAGRGDLAQQASAPFPSLPALGPQCPLLWPLCSRFPSSWPGISMALPTCWRGLGDISAAVPLLGLLCIYYQAGCA